MGDMHPQLKYYMLVYPRFCRLEKYEDKTTVH
jgi:hypothetical protein